MTRPANIAEIAVAATELLDGIAPTLPRGAGFDARVAARLLQALLRELEHGIEAETAERERLRSLLGAPADTSALDVLRERLCAMIEADVVDVDCPELLKHLWRTALDRLMIDQPAYRWRGPSQDGID